MSAVEISYKGAQIASMDATGVKTLLTGDTFCEDDIVIQYTAPSAPTPTGTKQITITQNGTTTEDVTNYANASIAVNVPNSYSASDEGKVVSNGALVAQSSDTVTQNGTVDTTLINSLLVNVSGGGGGGGTPVNITWYVYAGIAQVFFMDSTGAYQSIACSATNQYSYTAIDGELVVMACSANTPNIKGEHNLSLLETFNVTGRSQSVKDIRIYKVVAP